MDTVTRGEVRPPSAGLERLQVFVDVFVDGVCRAQRPLSGTRAGRRGRAWEVGTTMAGWYVPGSSHKSGSEATILR